MPDYDHPPIARHEAFVPLSRDHYVGLVHARRLVNASADPSADGRVVRGKALAGFLDAWHAEISRHVEDEERLLLPLIEHDADRRRLLDDHAALRTMTDAAKEARRSADPDPSLLAELGRRLEAHIRWEERELFSRLEGQLSADRLRDLRTATEELERSRPRAGEREPASPRPAPEAER